VSYELFAWPVDRPLPAHLAIAEIRVRAERRSLGFGRDRRVQAFASAMDEQYPGLGTASGPIPMEFDVHRDWVRIALPWTMARDLLGPIAWIAFEGGLALFDAQRDLVAMPRPFGRDPLPLADADQHERLAAQALGLLADGVGIPPGADLDAAIRDALRDSGFRTRGRESPGAGPRTPPDPPSDPTGSG